ncbi:hypothetical protein [Parasphingorhabdus sp.]|uniref:hypothetical protein n=1 Tax=Parasphingorhabdus sp. TaxID=2709688 RepID=UPI003C76A0D6
MLTFAIAAFFILTLIGAMLIIGIMLFGYRSRIAKVVRSGLGEETAGIEGNFGAATSLAGQRSGQKMPVSLI